MVCIAWLWVGGLDKLTVELFCLDVKDVLFNAVEDWEILEDLEHVTGDCTISL